MKLKAPTLIFFFLLCTSFAFKDNTAFGISDIGITAILKPTCPTAAGIADSITIIIQNYGTTSETNFPIRYRIDSGPFITETWPGVSSPSSIDTITLLTPFSAPMGNFSLCVSVVPADANPSNDTMCIACTGVPMSIHSFQNKVENKLSSFPNPTTGIFSLKIDGVLNNNTSISITDIMGKEIWNAETPQLEYIIDISNECNGIYIIHMISESQATVSKIILAK